MRLLIAGSREFADLELVKDYVKRLPLDTILINGRARGVDNVARNQAMFQQLVVLDRPANWEKYGKSAGIIRNHEMVDEADEVVVFWNGKSNGTRDVIEYAKSKGKLTDLVIDESVPEYVETKMKGI